MSKTLLQKKNKKHSCELLAPAGGMKQLIAAVENGADAVYLGGKLFNARINADNFDEEEMKEAVDYAHLRGVKIYVTVNTLIKDEELQEALNYAGRLHFLGVDALIVQDMGIAKLIKEYIPNLKIHLSTQGSVYNVSGVRAARELGFTRVVPARELTLEEIKEITRENICDIEVFVHGALCICYSGQCQMSKSIGGRSGNRGECAQPCRLAYQDEKGREEYFLSPKDLCAIESLPDLIQAGVASLKIEGRMKSPEYVATVTRIYRKYLDMYYAGETFSVSQQDKRALAQIFNRGGFTKGYLYGNPGDELLSGDLPKHRGIYIGKVVKAAGGKLIDVELQEPLFTGDGVEIQSDTLVGNIVTYIEPTKNGNLRIGDIKGKVSPGDKIYKISDKRLLKEARATFEGKGSRKTKVDMTFILRMGEPPELIVKSRDSGLLEMAEEFSLGKLEVKGKGEIAAEEAVKKSLDEETVKKQIAKTGETPFEAEHIKVLMDRGCSLPISEINKLRRKVLGLLIKKMTSGGEVTQIPQLTNIKISKENLDKIKKTVPEDAIRLPLITKGNCDKEIKKELQEQKGILPQSIIVENLSWIRELSDSGRKVFCGSGLNVYNEQSRLAIESLGGKVIELSKEADDEPDVLMITEHPIKVQNLRDRKGKLYSVEKNYYGDKYILKRK